MDCPITRPVRRYLGFLSMAIALVPAWGGAQTVQGAVQALPAVPPAAQGQPPRDRVPPQQRVGTAALKGRVVDGVTGDPVARARVRLMSGPAGPRAPVLTDSTGVFEFTALPQGPYNLMVEKSTYMAGRYPEAAGSIRARVKPLVLRDGQVTELTVPMFHGGAISGRVLDAHGDPVDFAQVRVLRVPRGGRVMNAGQAQTNDLGEYRVPRLQPGRYLVQVRPQMNQNYQDPNLAETPLPQPLPTYYPNAPAASQAQPVIVNRAETVSGVDMMLAEGVPTLVTGTVLRSDGEVASGGSVSTRVVGSDSIGGFDSAGGTGIGPGGTFRLTLAPGEYMLEAQVMTRQGPNVGPNEQLFGSARINVGGGSVDNVTIMVGRGATASGRIVFEGSTPPPPSPGKARVPLFNPDGPGCRSAEATIAADWTFKVEGLGGTCGAQPMGMFGRWTLKAVTVRGQNLMDQLVTFETGQQYTNVQVVVTDKRTQMELRVSGDDGQPTREYVALVFSLDKTRWTGPMRQMRTFAPPPITAAVGGTLPSSMNMAGLQERITGLPSGEYYVIALDDIESEDTLDPAVLERLTSSAIRVTLTDEGPLEVPLRRFNLADVMR
jgi:Carboxypeptidase regulatory-like domain